MPRKPLDKELQAMAQIVQVLAPLTYPPARADPRLDLRAVPGGDRESEGGTRSMKAKRRAPTTPDEELHEHCRQLGLSHRCPDRCHKCPLIFLAIREGVAAGRRARMEDRAELVMPACYGTANGSSCTCSKRERKPRQEHKRISIMALASKVRKMERELAEIRDQANKAAQEATP